MFDHLKHYGDHIGSLLDTVKTDAHGKRVIVKWLAEHGRIKAVCYSEGLAYLVTLDKGGALIERGEDLLAVQEGVRGSGRTAMAMLTAPHGARYVINAHGVSSYYRDLADKLSRKDLNIIPASSLSRYRGQRDLAFVIDHYVLSSWNTDYRDALPWLSHSNLVT